MHSRQIIEALNPNMKRVCVLHDVVNNNKQQLHHSCRRTLSSQAVPQAVRQSSTTLCQACSVMFMECVTRLTCISRRSDPARDTVYKVERWIECCRWMRRPSQCMPRSWIRRGRCSGRTGTCSCAEATAATCGASCGKPARVLFRTQWTWAALQVIEFSCSCVHSGKRGMPA